MEIGVYTFAELNEQDPAGRMRDLLAEAEVSHRYALRARSNDLLGLSHLHRHRIPHQASSCRSQERCSIRASLEAGGVEATQSKEDPE